MLQNSTTFLFQIWFKLFFFLHVHRKEEQKSSHKPYQNLLWTLRFNKIYMNYSQYLSKQIFTCFFQMFMSRLWAFKYQFKQKLKIFMCKYFHLSLTLNRIEIKIRCCCCCKNFCASHQTAQVKHNYFSLTCQEWVWLGWGGPLHFGWKCFHPKCQHSKDSTKRTLGLCTMASTVPFSLHLSTWHHVSQFYYVSSSSRPRRSSFPNNRKAAGKIQPSEDACYWKL